MVPFNTSFKKYFKIHNYNPLKNSNSFTITVLGKKFENPSEIFKKSTIIVLCPPIEKNDKKSLKILILRSITESYKLYLKN